MTRTPGGVHLDWDSRSEYISILGLPGGIAGWSLSVLPKYYDDGEA